MALNTPLLFAVLKLLTGGLMSEAMLLWFLVFLLTAGKAEKAA